MRLPLLVVLVALASTFASLTAHAAWTEDGTPICNAPGYQDSASVAGDADGTYIAWRDARPDAPGIYLQRVLGTGVPAPGWPANGIRVSTALAPPLAVADGKGGVLVVWSADQALHAQRINATGLIHASWPAAGSTVAQIPSSVEIIDVDAVGDGVGGLYVVWATYDAGGSIPYRETRLQHVNLFGDVALGWNPNGNFVASDYNTQMYPEIVTDGGSGAIVSLLVSDGTVLTCLCFTSDGELLWQENAQSGDYIDSAPIAESDHAGGVFLFWERPISGFHLYGQRVIGSGLAVWGPNGTLIAGAGITRAHGAVPDGSGGAVLMWSDERPGDPGWYAQRLTAEGVPLWPAFGTRVRAASAEYPSGWVADGAGGAIGVWRTTEVIQADHVLPGGGMDPAWGGSVTVCDASGSRQVARSLGGGAGGVLVAWSELRSGITTDFFDIYALRLTAEGEIFGANRPPDCSGAVAIIPAIWPPSHTLKPVVIAGVTDPDGDAVTVTATAVAQDEPVSGVGSGRTCPDARIVDGAAEVRLERAALGNGRTYVIAFTATDARGATCDGEVSVCVPQSVNDACVDDGLRFDALGACGGPRAEPEGPPAEVALSIERPEPGLAVLAFALPTAVRVELEVFDLAGRVVARPASGVHDAGVHRAEWRTRGLAAGLYFARLRAGDVVIRRSVPVMP